MHVANWLPDMASCWNIFQNNFKKTGGIADIGQKDKLSYISLLKQIEDAQKKDCSNKEIVSTVLRVITTALYLKNILEIMENSTLEGLIKLLQSHKVQKSNIDLYEALTSLAQSPQELVIQFAYRLMSLWQKLILASTCPGVKIPFHNVLPKRLFLKALETGLQSDAIVPVLVITKKY